MRPKVFVGLPRYGDIHAGAAKGFYYPSAGGVEIVGIADAAQSLTPSAFNDLFRLALDMHDAGTATHFAMIHADVQPIANFWLDLLWKEMELYGADLMSAVIPIKAWDRDDLETSTAIGPVDDPWSITRKILVSERHTLPQTFGAADVCKPGEVLLVNTGLWITDLRHPAWRSFPGFNIVTDIVKEGDEPRRARQRSEDWEMSRHLAAHGAKVMATWRVKVAHWGVKPYRNYDEPRRALDINYDDPRHPPAAAPGAR